MSRLSQKMMALILTRGEKYEQDLYREEKEVFSQIKPRSTIIEIGPGTGVNLPYYPRTIRWIGIDPNPELNAAIKARIQRLKMNARCIQGTAETIPLPDNSVDYVVSTLVLCSVNDPTRVLKEIKRVLKKGGAFFFIEHVADSKGTWRRWLQDLAPHTPWKCISDGCHPNRDTGTSIRRRFKKTELITYYKKATNPLVWFIQPHIRGKAIKT